MKLSTTTKLLAAALLLAAGTQQAFAAGPASSANKAGDTITNTASVQFTVGGVVQSATPSDTADFLVDRLINVTVTSLGNTNVTPGSTSALKFTVTNNTNSVMDYNLAAMNVAGDEFDAGAFTFYLDTDASGTYNVGDTAVTYLDEVASDAVITVFVVSTMPNPATPLVNGDEAQVSLKATAHNAGVAATLGAATTETVGADTAGVDNVFNDLAGDYTGDVARDGAHSDTGAYVISSASITVSKASAVVSDPVNSTTNPKAIPGATMVYCIAVTNGSATSTAEAVTVTDAIPAGTTYVAGSIRMKAGTVTCDATAITEGSSLTDAADAEAALGGNPAGSTGELNGGGVKTVTDLPVSATTTTIFQVTID